jgi:hypothetical protein
VYRYQLSVAIGFEVEFVIFWTALPFVTTLILPVFENKPPQYPSKAKLDDSLPNTGWPCAFNAGKVSNLTQTCIVFCVPLVSEKLELCGIWMLSLIPSKSKIPPSVDNHVAPFIVALFPLSVSSNQVPLV